MSRYIEIMIVEILQETDKALLCVIEGRDETGDWIPLSQIEDPDDYKVGEKDVEMRITRWFAGQKGIEEKED